MLEERPSVYVRLRLSEDALTFFDAGLEFVYFRQPTLRASHPAGGPETGSRVSLLGSGLHALLRDASAARCRVGDVVTAASAISPDGDELVCVVPKLAPPLTLGTRYPLAVALDGEQWQPLGTDDDPLARGGGFHYYQPPTTGTSAPLQGGSEARVNLTIRADHVRAYAVARAGDLRCRFGVAGETAAELVEVASPDPLFPELEHTEVRCAAPPCMRRECMGTVEVTLSLNGVDFVGVSPPLLFLFDDEFPVHAWGCEPDGAADGCARGVVQRYRHLGGEQHALAVRREQLSAPALEPRSPSSPCPRLHSVSPRCGQPDPARLRRPQVGRAGAAGAPRARRGGGGAPRARVGPGEPLVGAFRRARGRRGGARPRGSAHARARRD
jgi:hypothetical protein